MAQYGVASFDIHLKQCKELWIKREEHKPRDQRRPLPEAPEMLVATGWSENMSDVRAVRVHVRLNMYTNSTVTVPNHRVPFNDHE
jgi:hypothetical protein